MTAARHAALGWIDLVRIDLAGRPRVVRMPAADDVPAQEVDALAAADQATLLNWHTRKIARLSGLDVTFMAKPWSDQAGNGMHVHQSVWRDGSNLFGDGAGGLSAAGRQYVTGLLEHMGALAVFGSPTPNAYHRRADYSFSPTVTSWGWDNRTLAVGAITGTDASGVSSGTRNATATYSPSEPPGCPSARSPHDRIPTLAAPTTRVLPA